MARIQKFSGMKNVSPYWLPGYR